MSSNGGSFLSGASQTVGGLFSDITGGTASSNAIGAAGNAQLGQQSGDRSAALGMAQPTQQQLDALQSSISANNQQISNSQALLGSVDPALMEAGKQALSLMQGGSAASLAPIQNQRAQQRQSLQQQLSSQLGPDYATSTAGMQALNNFDQQTANLMTNAQQSTIGQYLGSSQSSAALGTQGLNMGVQQGQNINNTIQGNSRLQLGAITGTPVNPGLGYSGQIAQTASNQQMLGGMGIMGLMNGGAKSGMNSLSSLFGGSSAGGSTAVAGGAMDAGSGAAMAPMLAA